MCTFSYLRYYFYIRYHFQDFQDILRWYFLLKKFLLCIYVWHMCVERLLGKTFAILTTKWIIYIFLIENIGCVRYCSHPLWLILGYHVRWTVCLNGEYKTFESKQFWRTHGNTHTHTHTHTHRYVDVNCTIWAVNKLFWQIAHYLADLWSIFTYKIPLYL